VSNEIEERTGKDYALTSPLPKSEPPPPEEPLRFGGLDLAKRVHTSALEILKITKEDNLVEEGYKIWPHVKFGQVSKDVHIINAKMPMTHIGFDRSGVGDAAIEVFDTVTLPMTPILTTNTRKIDMFNSIETLMETGQLKLSKKSPLKEQYENQQRKIDPQTGSVKYPHGSTPNDSLMALGYAVYVALPFMVNVDVPMIIKRGSDQLNHYTEYNVDDYLSKLLGYESAGGFGDVSIHRSTAQRLFRK